MFFTLGLADVKQFAFFQEERGINIFALDKVAKGFTQKGYKQCNRKYMPQESSSVLAINWSPKDRYIISSHRHKKKDKNKKTVIRIWDPNTLTTLFTIYPIKNIVFSPNGQHIAALNQKGSVYLYQVNGYLAILQECNIPIPVDITKIIATFLP